MGHQNFKKYNLTFVSLQKQSVISALPFFCIDNVSQQYAFELKKK